MKSSNKPTRYYAQWYRGELDPETRECLDQIIECKEFETLAEAKEFAFKSACAEGLHPVAYVDCYELGPDGWDKYQELINEANNGKWSGWKDNTDDYC